MSSFVTDNRPLAVSEFEKAYEAGKAASLAALSASDLSMPQDGGRPYLVLPKDLAVVEVDHLLPNPIRIEQRVKLLSVDSFTAYVNRFKDDDTTLFANRDNRQVVGIIDYHEADGANDGENEARWGDHTATLTLRHSKEWKTWMGKNRAHFDQVGLAEFLDDNLPDVAAPSGAALREIVLHLEASSTGRFSQATRLQDGTVQYLYENQVSTKGKGELVLPETFILKIPVFENCPAYEQPAKLRYRIHEGKLTFHYVLERPDRTEEQAFEDAMERIEERTEITPLIGTAS